ncbi:MAG: prepilin peptidase [Thermoguttaceae bacterium]|jgi:leader peptidase (prepilin peptidase)/N-methyltransferase|nr:prepilin peptidase [Thermoguttaceae bacterium]
MLSDLLDLTATKIAVAVWWFALGAAVGSFLNVVVYRLPEGLSLVHPASHCPRCKHPIRWRDNVPVLGWIVLAGRCRDCGAAISPRYPLVEAVTATMFLVVAWVEGISGTNLPQRPWPAVDSIVFRALTPGESLGVAAYHLLLLSTLLPAALIEYDRRPLPARLAIPALVLGAGLPLVWPHLRPVPAIVPRPGFGLASGPAFDGVLGLIDGLAGLGVGMALGLAAWRFVGPRDRLGLALGPACVGLFLGWQAGAAIAVPVLALHAAMRPLARRYPRVEATSPGVWLWLATWGWILAWEPLLRAVSACGEAAWPFCLR